MIDYEKEAQYPREFENAVETAIQKIQFELHENFEVNPRPFENLPYHNTTHAKRAENRITRILQMIHYADSATVSERDIFLGRFIANAHDLVQGWEIQVTPLSEVGVVKRKRFIGDNEEKTIEKAIGYMDIINTEKGTVIFTDDDKEITRLAIRATIPAFDPNLMTVVQPYLQKDSPPIVRAMALADLGAAGMDGPQVHIEEGDTLFREENLDILAALQGKYEISPKWEEFFRERMLTWTRFQVKFVEGRMDLLGKELDGLPDKTKYLVAMLFNNFEKTLTGIKEEVARREEMTFPHLLKAFGYTPA